MGGDQIPLILLAYVRKQFILNSILSYSGRSSCNIHNSGYSTDPSTLLLLLDLILLQVRNFTLAGLAGSWASKQINSCRLLDGAAG